MNDLNKREMPTQTLCAVTFSSVIARLVSVPKICIVAKEAELILNYFKTSISTSTLVLALDLLSW